MSPDPDPGPALPLALVLLLIVVLVLVALIRLPLPLVLVLVVRGPRGPQTMSPRRTRISEHRIPRHITHNPHHAYLVGDHFTILNLGRQVLDADRDEVSLAALTQQMAGGSELEALSHELWE